jgi:hypothetical protein
MEWKASRGPVCRQAGASRTRAHLYRNLPMMSSAAMLATSMVARHRAICSKQTFHKTHWIWPWMRRALKANFSARRRACAVSQCTSCGLDCSSAATLAFIRHCGSSDPAWCCHGWSFRPDEPNSTKAILYTDARPVIWSMDYRAREL